jgi:uncharacterized protein YdhG (YjbR/CyaY superfamily)
MTAKKYKTVDEYIADRSPQIRKQLKALRKAIKESAPPAEEVISYNMPAFKFHGILVYYAAHKEHIGFYPGGSLINEVFKDQLTGYETSKGTIKFPYSKSIPSSLVKRIVKYKVKVNVDKKRAKSVKKK